VLTENQEQRLKALLRKMNVPDHRKGAFHPQNLEWLARNLPVLNSKHPSFGEVMTLVYAALPEKVTKKLPAWQALVQVALLVLCMGLSAAEDLVPGWIIDGILYTETRSYYAEDGSLVYVDRRRGKSKERGIAQITPGAFKQVKRAGEHFSDVETSPEFGVEIAQRYLVWLYHHHDRSWDRAIMAYNAGPHHVSYTYLRNVKVNGGAE
jgi:hypothetical protein